MNPLLIALLGVMLVPLFVSSWRMSLLGLSLQGFLMGWISYNMDPALSSVADWITLFDLCVVRGALAPLLLARVLRAQKAAARNDVIAANLLSWTFALIVVLLSFNFSEALIPEPGDQQTIIAVSASGILLSFLVLAAQAGPLSQMIGVFRFEAALALFELGGDHHHESLGIQLGLLVLTIATIGLFQWYLKMLHKTHEVSPKEIAEEPTL